ncbi:MAG: FHA domain-containing protein [Bdellovibrionota bacterium]
MNEEKRAGGTSGDFGRTKESADEKKTAAASRARNRTVMLTPEMTGHVRALLYQEPEEEQAPQAAQPASRRDPLTELLPPMDWSRPDQGAAQPSAAPVVETPPAKQFNEDFNKDFAPQLDSVAKQDRNSSTGKIDQDVVQEAVSTPPPEPPRRQQPAPQQPAFSVNPQAARPAAASSSAAATGVTRRPDLKSRPPVAAPTSKVVGFFVTFDKNKFGEVYEIRAGRWLITSRPTDHGEFILIEDETISPLHAIVRATKDGKIQVLDQLSEFGTGITRTGQSEEQEVSGTMVSVDHGDILRLGERRFVVCSIPAVTLPEPKADAEG